MNSEEAYYICYCFTGKYDTNKISIHKYIEATKYQIKYDFNDSWSLFYYAKILSFYGKYEESERVYLKILELNNHLDDEYNVRINVHLELGKLYLAHRIIGKHNKAYLHFLIASHIGHNVRNNDGAVYLALMYKEGNGVKKSYKKYKSIIVNRHYSEIETLFVSVELAKFYYEENDIKRCKKWVDKIGKYVDLSIYDIFEIDEALYLGLELKKLQYKLKLITKDSFDLYCIDTLKEKFNKFNIKCGNNVYLLEYDGNNRTFKFNGQNYRNYKEFLLKSKICGIELINLMNELKIYV